MIPVVGSGGLVLFGLVGGVGIVGRSLADGSLLRGRRFGFHRRLFDVFHDLFNGLGLDLDRLVDLLGRVRDRLYCRLGGLSGGLDFASASAAAPPPNIPLARSMKEPFFALFSPSS